MLALRYTYSYPPPTYPPEPFVCVYLGLQASFQIESTYPAQPPKISITTLTPAAAEPNAIESDPHFGAITTQTLAEYAGALTAIAAENHETACLYQLIETFNTLTEGHRASVQAKVEAARATEAARRTPPTSRSSTPPSSASPPLTKSSSTSPSKSKQGNKAAPAEIKKAPMRTAADVVGRVR